MAGLGRKIFTAGDVLTASDVQNYLMDQSVMTFAGTAARSSAIATPTTGMTSYIGVTGTATIPQIETYTGSAWQTPYGLTQVANVSFTSAASVQVSNVFTSAFDFYQVIISNAASATGQLSLQMTLAGTPNATSNYATNVLNVDNASIGGSRSAAGTAANLFTNTTGQTSCIIELINPAIAVPTSIHSRANRFYTDIAGFQSNYLTGVHNVSTAFDGFRLTPSTGNVTGTLRVYGYRNS